MHDTEVDKIYGESIRMSHNIDLMIQKSGYSRQDVTTGLGLAVEEFLAAHPEWKIMKHFQHQNGLTVLERV
jgi:hypothetical protein